ncbi:MAG: M20/M25/M40 family metallo-hydrolase, partial [Bacillota bacterium]
VTENKLVQSLAKMGGLSTAVENGKLTLTAHGKSAHASTPEEGTNALVSLMGALGLSHATYNRLYAGFCNYDGSGLDLAVSDEKSGNLTINLTTATIANNKMEFTVDIRHPISISHTDILQKLQHEFSDWQVTAEHIQKPLYVSPEHPLVATLLDAYNSVMGTNEQPIAIGGGTYARALPLGVAFGPVFPHTKSTIHQDDECVALTDFYKSIDIYYTAFKTLLF